MLTPENADKYFLKSYFEETREVPDFMLDNISFEVILDPWTTPLGQTYEKEMILESCKKNGVKDPVTGVRFQNISQIVPNKVFKRLTRNYVKRERWMFEGGDLAGDDWKKYEFK